MAWLDGHTRESDSKWPAIAMATVPNKTALEAGAPAEARVPAWPLRGNGARENNSSAQLDSVPASGIPGGPLAVSGRDALQALLAFSALHQQVRQRRTLASQFKGFEAIAHLGEFEPGERFVLDEVLQLVAERGIAITGADGLGIALAENNEIVLRAAAGKIKPDVGARIQRDSAFSGACFRTAQIIRCDDSENDDRVNLYACRQLGARSMVAVPLCGRRRVIGLLEAFSAEPFGFNDSDVRSLELLAALILGALRPEDEDRFAQAAEVAAVELAAPALPELPTTAIEIAKESALEPAPENDKHEDVAAAKAPAQLPATSEATLNSIEAVTAETLPELGVESNPAVEEVVASEAVAEPASRHPGRIIVLMMVVICALAGAGFWWKLKNAQLGTVMVRPEQKMTARPAAATRQSTPTVTPPTAPSSTDIDGHENSADATDLDKSAAASHDSASPQALAKFPHVTGIRHWSSADSSTVVFDLEDQVQYEAHRLANPDRIYFDLHDTALAADLEAKTIEVGDPLLTRVRVAQPAPA